MKKEIIIYIVCLGLFVSSCEDIIMPKPKAYPKIDFLEKGYHIEKTNCGYGFVIPSYATLEKDSSRGAENCWMNIQFKPYNATLHISYKKILTQKDFNTMMDDAHAFAYKHTSKADDIVESIFFTPNKVGGLYYEIEGNTASSIQFFATDSTKNYIRGALYFNSKPNKDSIAPIVQFIKQDIDTFIKSLYFE